MNASGWLASQQNAVSALKFFVHVSALAMFCVCTACMSDSTVEFHCVLALVSYLFGVFGMHASNLHFNGQEWILELCKMAARNRLARAARNQYNQGNQGNQGAMAARNEAGWPRRHTKYFSAASLALRLGIHACWCAQTWSAVVVLWAITSSCLHSAECAVYLVLALVCAGCTVWKHVHEQYFVSKLYVARIVGIYIIQAGGLQDPQRTQMSGRMFGWFIALCVYLSYGRTLLLRVSFPAVVFVMNDRMQYVCDVALERAQERVNRVLWEAAQSGHDDVLREMLRSNGLMRLMLAIPVAKTGLCDALNIASTNGHLACISTLLSAKAFADGRDLASALAQSLHCAVIHSHPECVALLLKRMACIGFCTDYGMLAVHRNLLLHSAIERGASARIVELLIAAGTSVNATSVDFGWSPLHAALLNGVPLRVTRILIAAKAEINATTHSSNSTPLHIAARYATGAHVRMLVGAGANLEVQDHEFLGGDRPLCHAVRCLVLGSLHTPKVIQTLLDVKADPDGGRRTVERRNERGTPLDIAVLADHLVVVEMLLAHGACPNSRTRYGEPSPADVAISVAVREALVRAGGRLSGSICTPIADQLVDRGCDGDDEDG